MKLIKREVFIDGHWIICRQTYKHHKTMLTQDVILTIGSRCIMFDTMVDFNERFRMLRTDFEPLFIMSKLNVRFNLVTLTVARKTKPLLKKLNLKYVPINGLNSRMIIIT